MIDSTASSEPDALRTYAIHERWGDLSMVGFTALPNTLIQAQSSLGISPTEMTVLLNLIMHWWEPDSLPFPRTDTIEKRSGLSRRTVQRAMRDLEARGLVRRIRAGSKTYMSLDGPRKRLEEVKPDFAWRRESRGQSSTDGAGRVNLPAKVAV